MDRRSKLGVAALIEATVGATVDAAEIGRAVPCTEDRKKKRSKNAVLTISPR